MKENMHRVGSKAGRHKPRHVGMNDKGRQRNSSMGRSFGKRNFSRAVR